MSTTSQHPPNVPPPNCPHHVLDAAGELAGWCETADGAARTVAEWNERALEGAPFRVGQAPLLPSGVGLHAEVGGDGLRQRELFALGLSGDRGL